MTVANHCYTDGHVLYLWRHRCSDSYRVAPKS